MNYKLINNKWVSSIPNRNQLEKLTIDELINLIKGKRSMKFPLKKALIDYLMQFDKI